MKKDELVKAMTSLGLHPGKKLGQNFLIDANLLDFIFRQANPQKGDIILEVGPGFGCLTKKLVESGALVIAIELDKRLFEYLKENINFSNFKLIQGDACRLDIESLISESCGKKSENPAWKCVANLPYSISTPFVMTIARLRNQPIEMQLLLQKETAERFSAQPSTKAYGAVSAVLQSIYDVTLVRSIPPQVFYPPPKVMSALSNFKLRKTEYDFNFEDYIAFIKMAFSFKRKKLVSNLSELFPPPVSKDALSRLNLSESVRAEELSPKIFIELYTLLNAFRKS
ncbi:MAG: 16S rRNA (adenine(1518)-N(6)/adenine(1519)-N(6))-dimethyltransferase RsmA [Candidatus Nanoarchaeia archaeon]